MVSRAGLHDPCASILPLHQLSRAVATATAREAIYEAALDCLRDSLDVSRASVLTLDEAGRPCFRAWRGLSDGYRAAVEGRSPWERGTEAPAAVLVPDVLEAPDLHDLHEVTAGEGIRALAFIPLVIRGSLLGSFMLCYDAPHEFAQAELMVAETIAAQVSFALDQRSARERITLYENIFRHSSEGIGVIDLAGRYVEQNGAHAALLGYGDGDLIGQSPALHLGDEVFADLLDALRSSGHFRGEVQSRTKDGRPLILDLAAFPVADEGGRVSYYIGMKRDITDRSRREAELREALAAKDAFLGMVSHELRTPLTVISANAALLERRARRANDEDTIAIGQEIRVSANRLSRIIDNMLALARIDQGVVPDIEPALIVRLVEQVIEEHRRANPRRSFTRRRAR